MNEGQDGGKIVEVNQNGVFNERGELGGWGTRSELQVKQTGRTYSEITSIPTLPAKELPVEISSVTLAAPIPMSTVTGGESQKVQLRPIPRQIAGPITNFFPVGTWSDKLSQQGIFFANRLANRWRDANVTQVNINVQFGVNFMDSGTQIVNTGFANINSAGRLDTRVGTLSRYTATQTNQIQNLQAQMQEFGANLQRRLGVPVNVNFQVRVPGVVNYNLTLTPILRR